MNKTVALGVAAFAVGLAAITFVKRPAERNSAVERSPAEAASRDSVMLFWERYRLATDHRIAGRVNEAAAAYAAAMAVDSTHEDALYYLGNAFFDLGRFDEAERMWRRLADVNKASARAFIRLGDLYLCFDGSPSYDPAAAATALERAAAINPEQTGPGMGLAEAALLAGDLDRAVEHLDAVLGAHAESAVAGLLRGYAAWAQGDRRTAREMWSDRRSHASDSAEVGLREGDTRSGRAMTSTRSHCQGLRDAASSAPVVQADSPEAAYRRLDSLVARANRRRP